MFCPSGGDVATTLASQRLHECVYAISAGFRSCLLIAYQIPALAGSYVTCQYATWTRDFRWADVIVQRAEMIQAIQADALGLIMVGAVHASLREGSLWHILACRGLSASRSARTDSQRDSEYSTI